MLKHEGISFLLGHSSRDGGVVLGPRGNVHLEGEIVGAEGLHRRLKAVAEMCRSA